MANKFWTQLLSDEAEISKLVVSGQTTAELINEITHDFKDIVESGDKSNTKLFFYYAMFQIFILSN